jgi:carboxyl-terminal processing protease
MAREEGLNAVVLDLRHNPGGILSEAVETVSLFVPKGTSVVSTGGRLESITQSYETGEDPYFADTPVVVLVDGISASASEIVSGALQDLDRAVIIGETTFGKGLVQIMRELPYNTSLKITVGHYYTPSGRDIQSRRIASSAADVTAPDVREFRTAGGRAVRSGVGVEPDVAVTGREPSELESALRRQGMFFRYAAHFAEENAGVDMDRLSLERDDLVPEFEAWLAEVSFEYRSNAEYLLDSLYVQFTDLEYTRAASSLDGMRNVTLEEKRMDFQRYRDDLWSALRNEILARLAGEQERIRLSLDSDPVALKALELARDRGAYRSLLGR